VEAATKQLGPGVNFELHPRQGDALTSKATELLYGGAAGGGKSHVTRVLSILWAIEVPGINIFIFRRLYNDLILNHLEGPTGLNAMLAPWINARHPKSPLRAGRLCEVVEGEIRFWNGSKIHLCHLQHQKDLTKYYGPEFHVLFLEEATQFTEYMIRFLRSRMRIPKSLKIPDKYLKPKAEWKNPSDPESYFPRMIYTSNPGGVGHGYIKRAFLDGRKPYEYHVAPADDGGHVRQYIPAKVDDNPSLNASSVKANLSGLPPALVAAMLNGDWNKVIGAYFPELDLSGGESSHLIPPFPIPSHWWSSAFMSMDWGAAGEGDPFAITWFVVSDGCIPMYPRDSLICYRVWYGRGLPKVTASQVALGILQREKQNETIVSRWAGGDILEKRGHGESIAEIFAKHGVHFQRADSRRESGWNQVRERLVGKDGIPRLYFFNTYLDAVETMQNLQHDVNNPNDCAPGDDHVADAVRYGCMSRPWVANKPKPDMPLEQKFKQPSLDDLWKQREAMMRERR
jgi:hypothetical protein